MLESFHMLTAMLGKEVPESKNMELTEYDVLANLCHFSIEFYYKQMCLHFVMLYFV